MRTALCLGAFGLLLASAAAAQETRPPATQLDEIGPAVRACWTPPPQLGNAKADVTVRFALRADGSLLGEPRVTAAGGLPEGPARTLLVASAVRAIRTCTPLPISAGLGRAIAGRTCTPLPISAGLGRAIAGRIFTLRFLHPGAAEQGVSNRV